MSNEDFVFIAVKDLTVVKIFTSGESVEEALDNIESDFGQNIRELAELVDYEKVDS